MQICPPNEEKWVLCASTKEDYTLWCHALEKYVKEKGVFVPGPSGLLPLNYASDDEGYRSSGALSYRSGASSPETVKRPKSYSDPKNPNSSILSIIRRGTKAIKNTEKLQSPLLLYYPSLFYCFVENENPFLLINFFLALYLSFFFHDFLLFHLFFIFHFLFYLFYFLIYFPFFFFSSILSVFTITR